jgi:outer membrane protein OmpA-like peptidoglycan-associated protein
MIKTFQQLSEAQKQELKKGVIEVSGRHMNRTALGIVDAIMQLYPNANFEELKQLLPDTINPSAPKNFRSLFRPYSERMYGVIQSGSIRKECETQGIDLNASHFTDPSEIFKTSDGVEVLVSKAWESKDTETGEHDLQNLINHVQQYGVRVVEFSKEKPFTKGGYSLEIINPTFYEELRNPKKKSFPWWIILLVLAILGILIFFIFNKKEKPLEVIGQPKIDSSKVTVNSGPKDEISQLKEDINAGKNVANRSITFNDIFFEFDSDKIKESSSPELEKALSLLNELPELKVEIIGHTSNEGKVKHNLNLSEKRAIAVKKWLVEKDISEQRLSISGKGSSEPITENDTEEKKEKNRRIEFKVTHQ